MSHQENLTKNAAEKAKSLGAEAVISAKTKVEDRIEEARDIAADEAQQVADAAEAASQQFDPSSLQADLTEKVAHTVEDVAGRIRSADLNKISKQVTDYARENPLVVIGGAALLGFAAARFLKARDPYAPRTTQRRDDPWGNFNVPS